MIEKGIKSVLCSQSTRRFSTDSTASKGVSLHPPSILLDFVGSCVWSLLFGFFLSQVDVKPRKNCSFVDITFPFLFQCTTRFSRLTGRMFSIYPASSVDE
jgi:hypothetical protein